MWLQGTVEPGSPGLGTAGWGQQLGRGGVTPSEAAASSPCCFLSLCTEVLKEQEWASTDFHSLELLCSLCCFLPGVILGGDYFQPSECHL